MLKLTRFVFCPRCGREEITETSEKSFRCDYCGYVYFHNTASAAAAIIDTPRGIAFVRRSRDPGKGLLDLPGGFIDYRESAEEGIRRELREELGVEFGQLQYVGSFPNEYVYRKVTYFTTDLFFRFSCDTPERFVLSDEASGIEFVTPGSIRASDIAFDSSKKILGLLGLLAKET